jgi:glutathione S-transferase
MAPKIIYFALPGRAEVARLMFSITGKEFEDKRLTFDEWRANGDLKAAVPFGQLPVLEVDGKYIAQSAAIDHYVAKQTGLLPEDPLTAALADQAYFFCEDIWQTLAPTMRIQDADEKIKARQELVTGALADKLKLLTKLVESRPGKYLAGDKLSHADLAVFCQLSALHCGWLDGVPTDLLESYPVLKDFRNSIANLPEVAAFYSKENDDIRNKGFKARP